MDSSTPARATAVTRRLFLGTAATASLAGPLIASSVVPIELAEAEQAATPASEPPAALAPALLAVVRGRVGEPMDHADEALLLVELAAVTRADSRLARARVSNADEPDTVFRA